VSAINPGANSEQWEVQTSSGNITTRKLFHATNAYSSNLLPELTGIIVPLKGHVAAIPPTTLYQLQPLNTTMAFVWNDDYDYLIQRRGKEKHVIVGGRDSADPGGFEGQLGDSDDSTWNESIYRGLEKFPADHFDGWSTNENIQKPQFWTGIMGWSRDLLPFLGELPGKKGQYLAAGFSGHGRTHHLMVSLI
jgi:glycine/D-amino acid oxidase-like deaminating enzyme